jgi:hypothetical protein
MSLRSTFVRARWLLLLLPLFALASTMQVGCTGGPDRTDDFAHEDRKATAPAPASGNNATPPSAKPSGKPATSGTYEDGYGYGYDDDDYQGYGYYE